MSAWLGRFLQAATEEAGGEVEQPRKGAVRGHVSN